MGLSSFVKINSYVLRGLNVLGSIYKYFNFLKVLSLNGQV